MTGRPLADGRWLLELAGRRFTAPEALARRWLRDGPPPDVAAWLEVRPRRRAARLRLTLVPARLVAWAGGRLAPATAGPALALAGLGGAAAVATTAVAPPAPSSPWSVLVWVLALGLVHELGHAAGLSRGGGRPGAVGVGWALVVPVLWCDVSEVGLLPRHERLRTDLAGPAWQLGAAGAAALLGLLTGWGAPLTAARLAAAAAAFSLLPLGRTDGGWALADAMELPSLDAPLPDVAGRRRRRGAAAGRLVAAVVPPGLLAGVFWRLRAAVGILWNGPPLLDLVAGTAAAGGLALVVLLVLRRSAALVALARHDLRRVKGAPVSVSTPPVNLPQTAARLTAALARAEQLLVPLDAQGLARRGPRGGWSVAQVLEHICLASDQYIVRLRPALDRLRDRSAVAADARYRSSLVGRILLSGVKPTNKRRVPAPRVFKPSPRPRDDVRDHLLRLHLELLGLMRAAEGRPLDRVAFGTPVSPLLRVNAWDAFLLLTLHLERHLDQVERILAADS